MEAEGARHSSVVPTNRAQGNEHKLKHMKSHLNTNNHTCFTVRVGQTLAQVAQIGCGVSILGDVQNRTGHGPAQLALLEMTSRSPFPPEPFCEFFCNYSPKRPCFATVPVTHPLNVVLDGTNPVTRYELCIA